MKKSTKIQRPTRLNAASVAQTARLSSKLSVEVREYSFTDNSCQVMGIVFPIVWNTIGARDGFLATNNLI